MWITDRKLAKPLYSKLSKMLADVADYNISTPEALAILDDIEIGSYAIKKRMQDESSIMPLLKIIPLLRAILQS